MTHTEAERATHRAYLDVHESRDALVRDLLASIKTATTLVDDLLALNDDNAYDLVSRLEKFYGRHLTVLGDVAVFRDRLETLTELHKTAAELEAEEIAAEEAAEDAREEAWESRNRSWLDMVTR